MNWLRRMLNARFGDMAKTPSPKMKPLRVNEFSPAVKIKPLMLAPCRRSDFNAVGESVVVNGFLAESLIGRFFVFRDDGEVGGAWVAELETMSSATGANPKTVWRNNSFEPLVSVVQNWYRNQVASMIECRNGVRIDPYLWDDKNIRMGQGE